jgi:hypothetical protein
VSAAISSDRPDSDTNPDEPTNDDPESTP